MWTPLAHVTLLDLGVVGLAFALGALAGSALTLRLASRPAPARVGADPIQDGERPGRRGRA